MFSADGDAPILSDVEEDGTGEPAITVTVESQPHSPTQATIVNTNNFIQPQPVIKSPLFKKVTFAAPTALPTVTVASASSILATAAEAAQIKGKEKCMFICTVVYYTLG